MKAKKELLRILRTEAEGIILDTTGRKNGRGAYICPNAECLRKAKRSKGLERSFKMPVADAVYDNLTKEIEAFEEGIRNTGAGDEGRQGGER